jgi:hypothetical protein
MTNDEFEKRYGFPVDDVVGRYESENTLFRKVNADLLEALETIGQWADDESMAQEATRNISDLAKLVINHAANDMWFGITEGEKDKRIIKP